MNKTSFKCYHTKVLHRNIRTDELVRSSLCSITPISVKRLSKDLIFNNSTNFGVKNKGINLFSPLIGYYENVPLAHPVTGGGVSVSPGLPVASQQADKGLDLSGCDVFFQQLAVVVQQGSDGVLGQDLVTHLSLHD